MGKMYDQIISEIVTKFKIVSEDNIVLLEQMNTGYSGAEVYSVELKAPSIRSGKYFLKIDDSDEEFHNSSVSKQFTFAAEYIDSTEVNGLYAMLMEIAGESSLEYKSFFFSDVEKKKKVVPNMVSKILEEALYEQDFRPQEMPLSDICNKMLTSKLSEGGTINDWLCSYLVDPEIPSINFHGDLMPNAFHYAKQECALSGTYYLNAHIHGDLHGGNIFLSRKDDSYAVIDWALAREDGFLFFDSAYFELSLLLQSEKNCSMDTWTDIVNKICDEQWDSLEFTGSTIVKKIHEAETNWIDLVSTSSFSHKDKMKYGQYIARMIAGLNFAGKKKLELPEKEKAFIFSCVFLKKLFKQAHFEDWNSRKIENWSEQVCEKKTDMIKTLEFADYCTHFSEQYKYILISGNHPNPAEMMNNYLARIPWAGVISLSNKKDEALYAEIDGTRLLRHLMLDQSAADNLNNIEHGAIWWMFADGTDSSSTADSYARWRNKNSDFLQRTVNDICSCASPQDLMLIIDCGSLTQADEWDKVQQILEWFDLHESVEINASILMARVQSQLNQSKLEHIALTDFVIDIEDVACYASKFIAGIRQSGIWLPHVDQKRLVQLEEDDEKYISTYLEVIGEHLLNNSKPSDAMRSLYWGEDTTWDAIEQKIPVERPEVQGYIDKIQKKLDDERWGCITLWHTPGAGATVLAKMICWQIYRLYPTVRIKQTGVDVYESLKRISVKTGSPLIIMVDGDFTRNDVETIETALKSNLVKYIMLYPQRVYERNMEEARNDSILTTLDINTAEKFERHYIREMERKDIYSPEQLTQRKEQLSTLTRDQSLIRFRLPFFYGMYAFEEDFVNIMSYTNQIVEQMCKDPTYQKIASYIALISYFTTTNGLSHKVAQKILKMPKATLKTVINKLNNQAANFVYITNTTYRICHPMIALKILTTQWNTGNLIELSHMQFVKLCTDFIKDIREMEGGDTPSEYASKLITDIFVTRGYTDSAEEDNDNPQKTAFAPIIQEIKNGNMQKEVFACLVEQFPDNPHCFQHYGRLLSSLEPANVIDAKEQFDKAINLERENPLHYHARGTMYQKHCKYLYDSKYSKTDNPVDVYNGCKQTVELALADFEMAVTIAMRNEQNGQSSAAFLLSYPYSSIINVCTLAIRTIMKKYGLRYDIKQFWRKDTVVARWCRTLLAMAKRYDLNAENVHTEVSKDSFYKTAKYNMMGIQISSAEIQQLIETSPKENDLKILYISSVDTRKSAFKAKTQSELTLIRNYCEDIIAASEPDGGVLWKWFNAYIHMDSFKYAHALGVLETVSNLEKNTIANYLLQIVYFCRAMKTQNPDDIDKALKYMSGCRKLTLNNQYRVSSRFYLTNVGLIPLTTDKETATKFPCTILEEVTKPQSAKMALDMEPQFEVFFVPFHNKIIKMGQCFNQPVKANIGFSYSGLRGYDLEL